MKGTSAVLTLLVVTVSLGVGQTAEKQEGRTNNSSQIEQESSLAKLRALGAVESPGSVPVFYVPAAKERALRLQKSLEASHAWYEKQLKIKVPILLAVVDAEMQQKIEDLRAWMYYPPRPGPKVIVLRDKMDERRPFPGADRDHIAGGILHNEHVLFHDDGHILADAVKIKTRNKSVDELVATVFMAMYITAERPDLDFALWRHRNFPPDPQRYTALADLDYLDGAMIAPNQIWYLRHLAWLSDSLTKGQRFPRVIKKLQQAFSTPARREMPEEINARLESVWPGFAKIAGSLAGPSTLLRATAAACQESTKGSPYSHIVIQNETGAPVTVTLPNDRKDSISEHTWSRFTVRLGEAIKLPDGTCLVGREEPTLTVIGKK